MCQSFLALDLLLTSIVFRTRGATSWDRINKKRKKTQILGFTLFSDFKYIISDPLRRLSEIFVLHAKMDKTPKNAKK